MARDGYNDASGKNQWVSVAQANAMGGDINSAMAKAMADMSAATNNFLKVVHDRWADDNAVKVAKSVQDTIEELASVTNKNNQALFSSIGSAVARFAKAGNKSERFGGSAVHLAASGLMASMVTSTFADGSFGFMDVKGDEALIIEALTNYKKEMRKAETEMNGKLRKMNVFGDRGIQNDVADTLKEIYDILEDGLQHVEADTKECLKLSKTAYIKAADATSDEFKSLKRSA